MIRTRRGIVREVLEERAGALEVTVEVEGGLARAICYPDLSGPVGAGDRVLLNTTAAHLGLGTGGSHVVMAVEGAGDRDAEGPGHLMKLRYTPLQVKVPAVEEEGAHAAALDRMDGLGGTPVVWTPLHSMLGPVAAGAVAAGAERVAYVMTEHAALPAALSRSLPGLRAAGLLHLVVTAGQAFGGDFESVSVFSGLLAAKAGGADVIVVGDGPGSAGTATTWGASSLDSAQSVNAAGILDGRPVVAVRVSFADPRERHHGVSHHSLTALSKVILVPTHVAVPALEDPEREAVWAALAQAELEERHQLVEVTGRPALDRLAEAGIEPESMGRGVADDPGFFLAAGAAGVLAGRMAADDRAWRGA